MRVQHNIMAMNAYRNYSSNTNALSKNLEKLSSGYKINRAGDDAAGLAISEKMRAQITGLQTAQSNAKSGINLVQTAEGSLTEVHDMLNRMVKLADQSANGTYDDATDRTNLQKEVSQLSSEIDRIADSSNFNGIKLLDGSLSAASKVSGTFGSTAVTFSASSKVADLGTAHSVTLNVDNAAATGITVSIANDTTGAVTVTLGSQAASTYTADQITQAVRSAAATAAKAGGANATIANNLSGFTMQSNNISLAAGATGVTTGAVALVDDATGKGGLTLQIGDTAEAFNKLNVSIGDMHTNSLGIGGIDIKTQTGASDAVSKIKAAINTVSSTRGDLGATQNRLDHTINNLSVMTENVQDAESTIRDTDVAEEMMAYTKNNILVQSAQAMLAQANQAPQGVLQLLQ